MRGWLCWWWCAEWRVWRRAQQREPRRRVIITCCPCLFSLWREIHPWEKGHFLFAIIRDYAWLFVILDNPQFELDGDCSWFVARICGTPWRRLIWQPSHTTGNQRKSFHILCPLHLRENALHWQPDFKILHRVLQGFKKANKSVDLSPEHHLLLVLVTQEKGRTGLEFLCFFM